VYRYKQQRDQAFDLGVGIFVNSGEKLWKTRDSQIIIYDLRLSIPAFAGTDLRLFYLCNPRNPRLKNWRDLLMLRDKMLLRVDLKENPPTDSAG